MEENNETIVEVTNEGIIFVNYLAADYEFLFNLIMNKSCHLEIASGEGYLALTLGMQNWMFENKSVEEYQEVTNFIKSEYKTNVEQLNG